VACTRVDTADNCRPRTRPAHEQGNRKSTEDRIRDLKPQISVIDNQIDPSAKKINYSVKEAMYKIFQSYAGIAGWEGKVKIALHRRAETYCGNGN